MKTALRAATAILLAISCGVQEAHAQRRVFSPEDLFRFERIGAIAWSPDRMTAAVEIHRPTEWLDRNVPTADIALVNAKSGQLRVVSPSVPGVIGFFRPAWSPDSERLVFLSVDADAAVRVWLWTRDSGATLLSDLQLHDGPSDRAVAMWRDAEHVVFMTRDARAPRSGPLYTAILRGKNVADTFAAARNPAGDPAVSVFDSWGGQVRVADESASAPERRIVSVNVRTGAVSTLASGALHQPSVSGDGRTLTYWREKPVFSHAPVQSFFGDDAHGETLYDRVNWGNEAEQVDISADGTVSAAAKSPSAGAVDRPQLQVTNTPAAGTRLTLLRPGQPEIDVWRGNAWVADLQLGSSEPISYKSTAGAPLTGWILYPPGYVAGRRLPIVTVVYPGTVYSDRVPGAFDIFNAQFDHPQLFAALGYGVVFPSMPAERPPLQEDALSGLGAGVWPLIDTLIARGIADPLRLAVTGQSGGGWATLGLITQSDRFRTAIASASYSNLVSLYGTFYGQYRYGDSGNPQRSQVLRMLQFERGYYGAGAPPWVQPDPYRVNSPLWQLANVRTALMLVHGDLDFVPVQQAEEFFTGLYRQDKRARFVRYTGEGHTIAGRANVLDLWRRIDEWLRETNASTSP